MAFAVEFTLSPRYNVRVSFPKGSAQRLRSYWGAGPVEIFDRAEIPQSAYFQSDRKTVADFIPINAKLAMCPEARDLIEELEPGKHQFFDVNLERDRGRAPIRRLDGRVLDHPYFLVLPAKLDAVWVEKSRVESTSFPGRADLVDALSSKLEGVVLRRDITRDHHLWEGERQLGRWKFCSDAVAEEIRRRKWKGLDLLPISEE